jgi:hypothetical protein
MTRRGFLMPLSLIRLLETDHLSDQRRSDGNQTKMQWRDVQEREEVSRTSVVRLMHRGTRYRMTANELAVSRMEVGKQRPIQSIEEARDWERLFIGEIKGRAGIRLERDVLGTSGDTTRGRSTKGRRPAMRSSSSGCWPSGGSR